MKERRSRLLGKLMLAQCLEMPLFRYERFIEKTENILKKYKQDGIRINKFTHSSILKQKETKFKSRTVNLIADIKILRSRPVLRYLNPYFAIEYIFSKGSFLKEADKKNNLDDIKQLNSLLLRLRLINSRNRITYEILRALVHFQKDYIMNYLNFQHL